MEVDATFIRAVYYLIILGEWIIANHSSGIHRKFCFQVIVGFPVIFETEK